MEIDNVGSLEILINKLSDAYCTDIDFSKSCIQIAQGKIFVTLREKGLLCLYNLTSKYCYNFRNKQRAVYDSEPN